MIRWIVILCAMFSPTIYSAFGQNKLFLKHKKSNRKKAIDFSREYIIKTIDGFYYSKKIVAFSDSSISVVVESKTGRDTTITRTNTVTKYTNSKFFQKRKGKDTTYTYSYVTPIYKSDTIAILFSKIQSIKKEWFKNKKWVEPFAWIGLGAAMGIALLPVAVIADGSKGLTDWLVFEAALISISAPPLLISSGHAKYDLTKKWMLVTE
jgi:hypothetical protein